ncbi:MAG: cache domain-containing protein, partial [Deltaproteobacteria bacterium]|nr:cache domain-containing protein [Deltaproteobacteria bacterium]
MTLRTKTSLLLAGLFVVILGIAGFFSLHFLENSLRNSIYAGLESISGTESQAISRFLDDTLRDAQAIASFLPQRALEEKNVAVIEEHLKKAMKNYPKFENGMFLLDAGGTLWADYPVYPGTRGKNFAFREYFKTTMEKHKGIIGVPYRSARTGEAVLTFTALLRGSKNQVLGIIGCSVQLLHSNALGGIRKTKIGESGYIYVYDTSRLMILHPEDKRILQKDVPPGANKLFDAAIEGFEGVGETVNSKSVSMLVSLKRIPGTDWIIGAQQPKSEAFAPIREARNRIIWGTMAAVLVAILIGMVAVRRLTEPLLRLRNIAKQLGQNAETIGDDPQRKKGLEEELKSIQSSDEIGDLTKAFKEMYERLNQTMTSLVGSAKDWERTFDSVHDPIFILDKENRIQRLNLAAAQLLKMDFKEAIGQPCYRLIHGTESPPDFCPHRQTLET